MEPEADNIKTDKIITKVNEYLKQFEGAVPEGKEEEYDMITELLKEKPESILLHSNCKYKEITVIFKVDDGYVLVYFLQEKKT